MILDKTAMLVTLNISCWSGNVTDKPASDEVTVNHNALADSAHVRKRLFPKNALKDLKKTTGEARDYHYTNTLPWPQKGVRLLTVAAYEAYRDRMDAYREKIISQTLEFIRNYNQSIQDARYELGDLFRPSDYPSEIDIRRKFDLSYRIGPVPNDNNFIADLAEPEIRRLRDDIRAGIQNDLAAAQRDIYDRLETAVGTLADKLVYDDAGKAPIFRDTLISNITDLLDIVPKLNIFGDANLTKICGDIKNRIAGVDADTLRPKSPRFDPTERRRVKREAENIRERLAGIYPLPEQSQAA